MSSLPPKKKQERRHVFLFRHCLRSLNNDIDFHGSSGAPSTDPLDYLSHWPEWNTPPYWCTEVGSEIIKGTGKFLLQRFLTDDDNDGVKEMKRIAFISDNRPRDVQTAFAMMSGMAEEIANQTSTRNSNNSPYYTLVGLDNIDIDPQIFHPFESNGFRSQVIEENAICSPPPLKDTLQAMEQRLHTVQPPGNMLDIMKWMEEKSGRKDLFHTFEPTDHHSSATRNVDELLLVSADGSGIQGAWPLIKYIAQSILYSRASGIHDDSFTNVTMDEYYNLFEWEHWGRDVQFEGNNVAAAGGGVMMARILHLLGSTDHDQDDVTLIFGHDSDLNAVATALGMTWTLPPPYHTESTPTPPGSGLHFVHDGSGVEISFMAPVFFADHTMTLNTSGILVEVPVVFDSFDSKNRGVTTETAAVFPIDAMRSRILSNLKGYTGSMDCFEAAEAMYRSPDYISLESKFVGSEKSGSEKSEFIVNLLSGSAVIVYSITAAALIAIHYLRKRKQKNQDDGYQTIGLEC